MHQAYPLEWPAGWKRAKYRQPSRYSVLFGEALHDLLTELERLRAKHIVISANIPSRGDGLPYSTYSEPTDPGVAVYWTDKQGNGRVIACDHWAKVRDNLRAIGLTVQSIRTIDRAGASEILDRAFTGFVALPSEIQKRHWRCVLDFPKHTSPTREQIIAAYKMLAVDRHPDTNGNHELMCELNLAKEEALMECSS